jgi:Flp pilus assembly pilin Flp
MRRLYGIKWWLLSRVHAMAGRGFRRDEGQTFVEYAMILGLIAIGLTSALLFLRGKIADVYSQITAGIFPFS